MNHGNGTEGSDTDNHRVRPVEEPLGSLTSKRSVALVQPIVVQTSHTGGDSRHTRPAGQPIPTLTTKADMCLATLSVS